MPVGVVAGRRRRRRRRPCLVLKMRVRVRAYQPAERGVGGGELPAGKQRSITRHLLTSPRPYRLQVRTARAQNQKGAHHDPFSEHIWAPPRVACADACELSTGSNLTRTMRGSPRGVGRRAQCGCADVGGCVRARGRPGSLSLRLESCRGTAAFGGHSGGFSASGNPSRKGVEKLEGLDELVLGDVARPECGEGGKGW